MAKGNKWLILELSDIVEDINYYEIESTIINVFGDKVDYFIPIYHERMGSYISTSVLMEGYVFVRDCPEIRQNLNNLQETRIFSGALFFSGKFQTVSSDVIGSLRKKLKNTLKRKFIVGMRVIVLEGVFKNLKGDVISIEDNGKKIMIKIKRLTREIIAPIPSTLLEHYNGN